MEYLKLFENHSQYEDYVEEGILRPNVSHCVQENEVHYNPILHDYSKDYLTFDILSSGTIKWKTKNASTTGLTISYSINDGDWTDITSSTEGASFNVSEGDKVRFKGNNSAYCTVNQYGADYYSTFSGSTAQFNLYGNIMSLISGDSFENATTLESQHTFESLFRGTTALISAENLILPVTTLTYECYNSMFCACTSLTTAPKLPATILEYGCYDSMFANCPSLTMAPELPATTLAVRCYLGMFAGCDNLTTAPELPATTLANNCYGEMFNGCTSLTTAPELPATILAEGCYNSMFSYCANLAIAPELPATTLASNCYWGMFNYCINLTVIPELSATTLANYCYRKMFSNCTSLTQEAVVPSSVTPVASSYCYEMYCGCSGIATHSGNYDSAAYNCEVIK